MQEMMLSGIGWGRQLWGVSRRLIGSYQHEASHELQATQSSVSSEEPIYNEHLVRKWLASFPGGSVQLHKDESSGAAHLVLENQGRKNALTGKMMIDFSEAITEVEKWDSCRYLILRGKDDQFCSGGDLNFMKDIASPASGSKMSIFMQALTSKLYRLPPLSIALVQGHTLGGGAELAVACDFRVMTKDSKIGFVQAHLGVSPGWGGGTHLTRLVGSHMALKLLTMGKILDAEEALSLGLVDAVLEESGDPVGQTMTWASNNWKKSWVDAVHAAKTVVRNVEESGYSEALNRERDIFTSLWGGRSHKESLRVLFQKKAVSE